MGYVAYRMLVGNRSKFISIILGLSFASLIMTQQPGVFVGLMNRTTSLIQDIGEPDIWVTDPSLLYMDDNKPLASTALQRVASIEGVAWAKPLFKDMVTAHLRFGLFQSCYLLGLDDATLVGAPAVLVEGKISDLRKPDAVIVNLKGIQDKLHSRGDDPLVFLKVGDTLELNDRRAVVVGIADISTIFQSQPVIFTTYSNAQRFSPQRRQPLSYVLVKALPGYSVEQVCQNIRQKTGLGAYSKEQFQELTLDYYLKYTGIPINFGISVLLGFLVGAAVAGQSFFGFILENLRYFGLLKAMGASQKVLRNMVLLQALVVTFIGYGMGLLLTTLLGIATKQSVLAFKFPLSLLFISFLGVLVISISTALLSIRQLAKLDAAIVFKGQ